MEQPQLNKKLRQRVITDEPERYNVIMHNDDFTTMEFVVRVLETVFHKERPEAERLMMQIHTRGKAIVGVYTYDIATTKVMRVEQMAREENFPLLTTIERV